MFLRLCSRRAVQLDELARLPRRVVRLARRARRPDRYSRGERALRASASPAGRRTRSRRRARPGPGPMSRMRSAASMICGSCSTTTSVLPASRSRFITLDHAAHVARVQADRGLVEHEQRVDERGAERGGEVDALHLAARERARLAVERQVAEADVAEVAQPRADLAEQQVGRLRPSTSSPCRKNACVCEIGSSIRSWIELAVELPQQRLGLQARAEAGGALGVGAVLREQHPDVHLVGLALQPLEEAAHAVPDAGPGLAPAHPFRLAFEDPVLLLLGQVRATGCRAGCLRFFAYLLEVVLALLEARRLPGPDRAAAASCVSSGTTRPKSTPITRPKPRQVSQAPSGELNENIAGVGSE